MSHYTSQTHFFRDLNDDRTAVTTTILPDGSYEAELVEHPTLTTYDMFGHGDTRMAAIADLQEKIDLELNQ